MKKFYLQLLLVVAGGLLSAQCYSPQSFEARLLESDMIAFGKVVDSEAVYNNRGEIYTLHKLAVDRSFSSTPFSTPPDTLMFYTMGGQINEEQTIVYPSLRGVSGAAGMFLLREYTGNRISVAGRVLYRPTAVHESLIAFDETTGNFTDGDTDMGNIDALVRQVVKVVGRRPVRSTDADYRGVAIPAKSLMPTITSLSPLAASAGVGEVLTIAGSGFGSTRGTVFFDSPDDGPGGSFTGVSSQDILSWTDREIRVLIVSEAGGGRVLLRTAGGTQVVSEQSLRIDYAITNLQLKSGEIITPLLIDDEADGNGGYEFAVSNSVANGGRSLAGDAPALAALTRAFTTWQNDGDFSIYLAGETSIQVPTRDDNVNIVAYDSDAYDFDVELSTGTVGIAFSYYNSCGSSEFEITGADVLFRRPGNPNGIGGSVTYDFGANDNFGTDFESVALHELGHVHQLKHVSDPGEVMSFRITNGATQRVLSADTKAGADYVTNLSLAYDPPIINCGGDFREERAYQTFSQANAGSLPVEWLSFTASSQPKDVLLVWRTASETDNEYFSVERSGDGVAFEEVGRMMSAPANAAGGNYQFSDAAPLSGRSYYRIRQVDYDGNFSFSVLREVTRRSATTFTAYPNPAVDELRVADPAANATSFYRIFDGAGRSVRRVRATGTLTQITVADLPRGQYYLRSSTGESLRFIR